MLSTDSQPPEWTEEDTFNRLKRISLQDMTRIWYESPMTLPGLWDHRMPVPIEIEKLFNNHGWSFLEWREQHQRTGAPRWKDPALDYD